MLLCTRPTKRTLKRADHCIFRIEGKVFVAPFAIWTEFQHILRLHEMGVFYIHFNEGELAERLSRLNSAGINAQGHFSTEATANLKDPIPEALVLSLDRLPSHSHAYAEWLWEAKKRQHIPIVFVGGKPDKIKATRAKFPTALYCSEEELPTTLKELK